MKRNRKGFSLVELIVVLVIMAIIAALCAPNISAYVQAAKVQNYQTVANNLADELQTQLPQSRYWNWDEVQRNAYGILCADAGRCVTLDTEKSTDNQKVYQITGASSDANAVFTVTLTYHDAVKTSQKVDIAVSCDGYAAVQSVQECNLVLKTNYTDASAYEKVSLGSTTITTTDRNTWKSLNDDRVKVVKGNDGDDCWNYWLKKKSGWSPETYVYEHPEWKDYDYTMEGVTYQDYGVVVNVTDYPVNMVSELIFNMDRYHSVDHWVSVSGKSQVYHFTPIYPCVQANGGMAINTPYTVCGDGDKDKLTGDLRFANVYVWLGDVDIDNASDDQLNDKSNWGKYNDIFNDNFFIRSDTESAQKYIKKYDDKNVGYYSENTNLEHQVSVTYKVILKDPKIDSTDIDKNDLSTYENISCRGGIAVWGVECYNESKKDFLTKYSGKTKYKVKVHTRFPEYIEDLNTIIDEVKKPYPNQASGEKKYYYDTRNLESIGSNKWKDSYGNIVEVVNLNSEITEDAGARNLIHVFFYRDNREIVRNSAGQYYYFGNNNTVSDEQVQLTQEERNALDLLFSYLDCNRHGTFIIDMANSGYSVGDVISITFSNLNDVDEFINYAGRADPFITCLTKKIYDESKVSGSYGSYYKMGNSYYDNPDLIETGKGKICRKDDHTAIVYIPFSWSDWQYIKVEYYGVSKDFELSGNCDISWSKKNSTTTTTTDITDFAPMLTLNGDSIYTNITLDWTKCDYITNAGEVGVKFVKYPSTLNYDVYSKDYTLLASDQNLKTFMMNSNRAVTSAASADKIVHLYCKGVSPEEIQCEIVAPKNTATTTTTTTTTPLPPETETTAKTTTSKTTAATTTTTATTATTTTTTTATTTTTTTTTAATTSTAATTATTATAATTTAETTASSTATATTSATETTAATTTTSATTSTTISTTATTATTSTSATETSGGVVTSVIENASYNQEITIPNYKNIIAIDVVFENANNGGGEYIIYNNDSDAVRESYYINKNQLNLHIDVPGSDNGIVMYSKFKLTHWGDGNIKSITFVYRDTVPLEWLVDDGYTVQSKNEMATLNSNYEFTITWNKDTKNIPAVVANCDVISPKSSTESTATYSVPISQKTRISVVNGSAVTLDNVAFSQGIDLTQYNFESIYAVEIQVGDFTSTRGSFGGAIYEGGWENRKSISLSPSDWNDSLKVDYTVARNRLTIDGWNASLKKVVLYFNRPSAATAEQIVIHKMMRNDPVSMFLVNSSEHQTVTSTTTLQTTAPQTTTTTTTTTTAPPIAASGNGKNVGLDESSAAGCNITFSDPLFNDSGVCYFTITPKAGYTLSDSYTVKVGTEVLSAKNNYNAKTGQWFFWSNKIMTDYTIHVEGVSPAA